MFEPEELMARIVDLEEQLKVSEMAPPAAEQLIACLEGEIAKRDARIVELERYRFAFNEWHDKTEWVQAESATLSAKYLGCHRADVMRSLIDGLRAELAAIKAQEPAAWAGAIEYGVPLLMVEPQNWKATPLYAAPVSEAKAHGVVQWPEADEIMQMAFEEGQPADDASGYCFELEEFDLFIERLMSEVARLNAAPAAPAADAGASLIEWTKDAVEWGGALNYAAWEFVNECPEKSALLFNNTKGPLRAAIIKYAEIVSANAKDSSHDQ